MQNTIGAAFHPALRNTAFDFVVHKGTDAAVDSYSAFFDNGQRGATALDAWLRQHGITRLWLLGLATDYCVKFSVLDALRLGYQVNIISDGCRGVDLTPGDSERALAGMVKAGAALTPSPRSATCAERAPHTAAPYFANGAANSAFSACLLFISISPRVFTVKCAAW